MPDLTFFIDANLCGRSFYEPLQGAGFSIELHNDHFQEGTPDDLWLEAAGREGWIVLSRDKEIRRDSFNTRRLMESRVRAFMLVGNAPKPAPGQKSTFFPDLAENFIRTIHKVHRFLEKHPGPFIAKILRPPPGSSRRVGEVEMWLTYGDWQRNRRG